MVRINTVFPATTLEKLDQIAKEQKKSRSSVLREAAELLIGEHQRRLEERRKKDRMRKAFAVQDRLRRKAGNWDGVAELRKWRDTPR